MKKVIGLSILLVALGMLLMLIVHNRLVGLIIIALLFFAGITCFCGD